MGRSRSPDRMSRNRRGYDKTRRSISPDASDKTSKRHRSRSRERGSNRERNRSRSRENNPKKNDSDNTSTYSRLVAASGSSRRSGEEQSSSRAVWGNVAAEEEYANEKRRENGEDIPEEKKEKANFGLTGTLAKDEKTGNMYNGVLLKWTEPLDAAAPPRGWRMYVFKGDDIVETLYLHRQSAFLLGREQRVADHTLAHPSCSGQHAVIQWRAVIDSSSGKRVVKPYIMDLASTNKTYLNGTVVEDSRYYELKEKDVIKFGHSTREYVIIRDKE